MPKIIENLRENIIIEARRQLFENGYLEFNIRGLAKNCHTAVGTIYNYFPSKDMLVASILLEDWIAALADMKSEIGNSKTISEGFEKIYNKISEYNDKYRDVFLTSKIVSAKYSFPERHTMLQGQISSLVQELFSRHNRPFNEFTPVFIAESLLTGSMLKWDYTQLDSVFTKII